MLKYVKHLLGYFEDIKNKPEILYQLDYNLTEKCSLNKLTPIDITNIYLMGKRHYNYYKNYIDKNDIDFIYTLNITLDINPQLIAFLSGYFNEILDKTAFDKFSIQNIFQNNYETYYKVIEQTKIYMIFYLFKHQVLNIFSI